MSHIVIKCGQVQLKYKKKKSMQYGLSKIEMSMLIQIRDVNTLC